MPFPTHQQLLNAVVESLQRRRGPTSISEQIADVTDILELGDEAVQAMQTERRSRLDYRLAWARNHLKRLGLAENIEKGSWRLTKEGELLERISADDLRRLEKTHLDQESSGTGVELEDVEAQILKPFDPTLIRVESKPATLGQLISRIEHKEIDLSPAFQRKAGIWTDGAQSRLIESILVRIPIPAFYFDASNEDKWVVVDGLQRLTALKRFALDNSLVLKGMEFLDSMEGKNFDQLPRSLQRRIAETGVTVFLIEKNTPPTVKFNIFKRINTGGLPLSTQEIRHALNQGPVIPLLEELATSDEFKTATDYGIRDERMADRECVLRFLAFSISTPSEYKESDFDGFLSEKMMELNGLSKTDLEKLRKSFTRAMNAAHALFGRDAFRKPFRAFGRRMPINKALFESWSVNLGRLTQRDVDRLLERRERVEERFSWLSVQEDFFSAISQGTGDPRKVRVRFAGIREMLEETLK